MSPFKKIVTSLVLIAMVFSVSPAMALTFTEVVNLLQAPDINLPTGVTNPKGNIGFILSNLFWGTADGTKNGKIKPQYLDYSGISAWTQSGTITYLTASTGSVGIGTPNPGEYATAIRGIDDTATAGGLWVSGQTAGIPGLMVRNDGNVGIGTASPSAYLHVKGVNIASRGQLTLEGSDFTQMTFYKDATTRSMSFYQNQADGSLVLANAVNNGNISNIITGAGSFFFQGGNGLIATINGSAPANSLYVNSTGNVGIGTADPVSFKLHVDDVLGQMQLKSTTGTNRVNYRLKNTGGDVLFGIDSSIGGQISIGSSVYSAVINHTGNYPMQFGTNNTVRMTISNDGNVGIGATPTGTRLKITQSTDSQWASLIENISPTAGQNYGLSVRAGTTSGDMSFNVMDKTSTNYYLHVRGDGNVGIGTGSPATKLHVVGAGEMVRIENTNTAANSIAQVSILASGAGNYIWSNNNNSSGYYGGSSALNIYTGQDSPIAFFTHGSERMRIGGTGNIGIGTAVNTGVKFYIKGSGNTTATYPFMVVNSSGTNILYVNDGGGGYLGAAAWSYGSDRRLKEKIIPLSYGIKEIMKLDAKKFDYIKGEKNNLGFIAQDVQSVFPELITTQSGGMLGLKTDMIIPVLVNAMKEQQRQIERLTDEVRELKKR